MKQVISIKVDPATAETVTRSVSIAFGGASREQAYLADHISQSSYKSWGDTVPANGGGR